MKATELIRSRRSIHDWEPLGVSQETILTLLDAAAQAPNHHLTQPWEFIVVTGRTKERLAELRGEAKAARMPDPASEEARRAGERSRQEMAGAAAVVVATCPDSPDPVRSQEDLCATAAAVQNLCLAACDESLGTFWTTGPLAAAPSTREFLQIPDDRRIVAIVLLGYPASVPPLRRRQPVSDHVRWLGD